MAEAFYVEESDWDWEDRDSRWLWRALIGLVLAVAVYAGLRIWFDPKIPAELMMRIAYASGAAVAVFLVFHLFFFRRAYIVLQLLAVLALGGMATVVVLGLYDAQLSQAHVQAVKIVDQVRDRIQ
ncbi:MAG: hypothetical protein ACOY45_05240 [Pseudomonadota bacterium]